MVLALASCSYVPGGVTEADAAAVFTLDVNPGIRVYVDEDNKVISLEATNDDGKSIVAEITYKGETYEEVVEDIVDEMNDQGYIEGDDASVLITIEKQIDDLSEKLNAKLDEAFAKYEKHLEVIEQHLDKLEEDFKKDLDELSKKYDISRGKAHLIDKIREEYPELSAEELAQLSLEDLRLMLEETSEDVKDCFHKIGEAINNAYLAREAAIQSAVESLDITVEDVKYARARLTRDDGKMVYEVEFVYADNEYEIEIDAESGEILETECEPFEEIDISGIIDDFCNKHGISGGFFDHIDDIFGKLEGIKDEIVMKRGEIIDLVIEKLELIEAEIEKTEIELHKTEDGSVYSIEIETANGDEYELVLEAATGTIIKATLNDTAIEVSVTPAE